MDIFLGNLSFDAVQGDVERLFKGFGNVASVMIVMEDEKRAPKSRGFGFVQMPDEEQALAAIAALNGKEFMGRVLNVNVARHKVGARKPGTYKSGRRTQSYMKKRGLLTIKKTPQPRRIQDNPMRWIKKKDQARPWKKVIKDKA